MAGRAIVVGLLVAVICSVGIAPMQAQSASKDEPPVTIHFRDAPIREALDTLFKGTGKSYVIEPGITGMVTFSIKDTPFATALHTILKANGLTCNVESGVYVIGRKIEKPEPYTPYQPVDLPGPVSESRIVVDKISIDYADVLEIAAILSLQQVQPRYPQNFGYTPGGYGYPGGYGWPGARGVPPGYDSGYSGYGSGYPASGYSGYGPGYPGGYGRPKPWDRARQ